MKPLVAWTWRVRPGSFIFEVDVCRCFGFSARAALMPGDVDDAPGPLHLFLDKDASNVSSPRRPDVLCAPPFATLEAAIPDRDTCGGQEDRREKGVTEDESFHPPHGSWAGAARHFSGEGWKEYVWQDYLTQPAALIPLGIGAGAAIWAGIPAYALGVLTGYSRIDAARHYPSDVLAGAAIGTASARIFDALHWGIDGQGGIARPPPDLKVSLEGRRDLLVEPAMRF